MNSISGESNKESGISSGRKNYYIALAIVMLTNVIMSFSLIFMSRNSLREQINQRMLDIVNTAADQLNGDELEKLTASDVETEEYQRALEVLRSFQDNIQLEYIYGINEEPDGSFTFSIDPAENDPGVFGDPIVSTDALKKAAAGTPAVDQKPYEDSWGRFYSAYSPVYDSEGKVAGIVAVDFNAEWYEKQFNSSFKAAAVLTMIAMTFSVALLREKRQHKQIKVVNSIAYIDPLTKVKSKQAYVEKTQKLDEALVNGSAPEFGVIVFDLNGLKHVNDTYGHDAGDKYITDGCKIICRHYVHSPVYRVGGDEFVVILSGADYKNRIELIRSFERMIEENQKNGGIVIASGMDVYNEEFDSDFISVFNRADQKIYIRKRFLKEIAK